MLKLAVVGIITRGDPSYLEIQVGAVKDDCVKSKDSGRKEGSKGEPHTLSSL